MKKNLFIILAALGIITAFSVIAAEPTKLIVAIPVEGGVSQVANPGDYIRYIYLFGLSIGGLLGMAIIVYAAIERILSAGNASKIADANDRITQAAIGLVLLFGAYIILRAINPNLTSLNLPTLQKVEVPSKNVYGDFGQQSQPLYNATESDLKANQAKYAAAQAFTQQQIQKANQIAQQKYGGKLTPQLQAFIDVAKFDEKQALYEVQRNQAELARLDYERQLAEFYAKNGKTQLTQPQQVESDASKQVYEEFQARVETTLNQLNNESGRILELKSKYNI